MDWCNPAQKDMAAASRRRYIQFTAVAFRPARHITSNAIIDVDDLLAVIQSRGLTSLALKEAACPHEPAGSPCHHSSHHFVSWRQSREEIVGPVCDLMNRFGSIAYGSSRAQ